MLHTPPRLALCLEYPLGLRGGVSVLVEELIAGLAGDFEIVLVSPDASEVLALHPLASRFVGHVMWEPAKVSRATSRALPGRLCELGVVLAHFHCGGSFGWGMRGIGHCPIPYAAAAGLRCVTTVHRVGGLLEGYCGPAKPWGFKAALLPLAWLGKMHVLAHTAAEICVSRHNEALLRSRYAPLAGRFRMIYHSRLRADEPPPTAPREAMILNVGHLAHAKGQHVLVEAFARVAARHPAWRLQLAGPAVEAPDLARVREAIARSGVSERVELLGGRDDARDLMRTAGIYVQPSLEEALGLALQEALFAGCPAIASDAGGIPELITDGDNGLLVPRDDLAALAGALDRLLSDDALRARLGARARPSIAERGMTAAGMIEHHVALYREVLAREPRAAQP